MMSYIIVAIVAPISALFFEWCLDRLFPDHERRLDDFFFRDRRDQ